MNSKKEIKAFVEKLQSFLQEETAIALPIKIVALLNIANEPLIRYNPDSTLTHSVIVSSCLAGEELKHYDKTLFDRFKKAIHEITKEEKANANNIN